MVAISEIREIDIRVKTTGVEQATTATNRLAGAEEQVVQATEKFERSTSSLTRALERHQTSLDREYSSAQGLRRVTDDLAAARARDLISVERHNQLLGLAATRYGAAGRSAKLAGHEVTMMGAQFMDLGTQIASGGGLFLPLIQQGGQLAGQLGDRGARGAVRALGQGLLSFATNPVNLAVVGVAGLAAGISYLAASGESEIEKLDGVFRRHEKTIKDVRTAYGAAAVGLKDYADPSTLSVRANANSDRLALQATMRSQATSFLGDVVKPGGWGFDPDFSNAMEMIKPQYRALATEIERFQVSARAGVPDFRALRDATAELYLANPNDVGLAKLWTDLNKATEAGLRAQDAFGPLTKTIGNLNELARATAPAFDLIAAKLPNVGEPIRVATEKAQDALSKYVAGTSAMQGTPLEQALAREKNAFDELSKSILGTRGQTDALAKARTSYDQRTAAVRSQFNDEGTKGQTAFERALERGQERLATARAEAATFGMTPTAAEAYRMEIDLINAAQEKGKTLSADQVLQLRQVADALVERDFDNYPDELAGVRLDFNVEALA